MSAIVHQAGPLGPDGVQRCTRCGYTLSDYRHAMVEIGSPPLTGFEAGAQVGVYGRRGVTHFYTLDARDLHPDEDHCEMAEGPWGTA